MLSNLVEMLKKIMKNVLQPQANHFEKSIPFFINFTVFTSDPILSINRMAIGNGEFMYNSDIRIIWVYTSK